MTKDHPILERAFEYEVTGFNFRKTLTYEFEPYIDITLQIGNEIKRLRFLSPANLKIEKTFPMTHGFSIVDISDKHLDYKVEVFDFEEDSISFRARKVIDLDKTTEADFEILQIEFEHNLNG